MADNVKINIDGKILECPVIVGTEGEKAFDIAKLRSQTGFITMDPGFGNTGSCKSAITYLDGEKGILRYRGIPIEQLAERSTFVETSYLLIYGKLPDQKELEAFSDAFNEHSMIHEDMKNLFDAYPSSAHPMASLSAMVCSMSAYYPELIKENPTKEEIDRIAIQLLSKVRTICAFSHKKSIGEAFVYPRHDLRYVPNFLNMMFTSPTRPYKIVDEVVRALEVLLILHADHEQNCSTSAVRLVGSSHANLYASISAGICALWGPLHGGANQAVIEMLELIQKDGGDVQKYIAKAKDKNDTFRLMGFGHRVYKNFDPRAKIIKKCADDLLNKLGINDPLLDLAKRMEEAALKDEYFIERKLYPNVDFYSGIIYRAIGIPLNMFPAMFAIGRMPGWIAHWKEMIEDPTTKIGRPFQIYTGAPKTDYVPYRKALIHFPDFNLKESIVISFSSQAKNDKDVTVILLASGQTHPRFKTELDKGEIYPVLEGGRTLLFVGLGKIDKLSLTDLRIQVRKACLSIYLQKAKTVQIIPHSKNDAAIIAIIEGVAIGSYVWDKYKSKDKDDKTVKIKHVTIAVEGKKVFTDAIAVCQGVNLTRDLINDNADTITSDYLEKTVRGLIKGEKEYPFGDIKP